MAKKRSLLVLILPFLASFLGAKDYSPRPALLIFGSAPQDAFSPWPLDHRAAEMPLAEILRKAKEYCYRLEKAALEFVCRERVLEQIDLSRDRGRETDPFSPQIKIFLPSLKNNYLYDYQFIRKEDNITERRTLLEENGKKKNEPEAKLKTRAFRFRDVLFGPMGLLGEKAQSQYEYQLETRELLDGKKTAVIRAYPLASSDSKILAGKVWVGEDDFAILKVEWLPETIGHFETISRRAKRLGATPLVTAVSEYGFEKNGIRFPSRSHTEEAYLTKKGKKFVRSETTVLYLGYRFFTVQTQVEYAAMVGRF